MPLLTTPDDQVSSGILNDCDLTAFINLAFRIYPELPDAEHPLDGVAFSSRRL